MKHIVKRGGHVESYDERKLYASVYAAALATNQPVGVAELIAKEVVALTSEWLETKHEVTSNDIRRIASERLKSINSDVAYHYQHHRMVW